MSYFDLFLFHLYLGLIMVTGIIEIIGKIRHLTPCRGDLRIVVGCGVSGESGNDYAVPATRLGGHLDGVEK